MTIFPVFSPNTGKYGPEKTPYLDTFDALVIVQYLLVPIVPKKNASKVIP